MKWGIVLSFPGWEQSALHPSNTGTAERMSLFVLSAPDLLRVAFGPKDFSFDLLLPDKRIAGIAKRLEELPCDFCDGLPEVALNTAVDGPITPPHLVALVNKGRKVGPTAVIRSSWHMGYYRADIIGATVTLEMDLLRGQIRTSWVHEIPFQTECPLLKPPEDPYTHLAVIGQDGQKTMWVHSGEKWIDSLLESIPAERGAGIVMRSPFPPTLRVTQTTWFCTLSVYPRQAYMRLFFPLSLLSHSQ